MPLEQAPRWTIAALALYLMQPAGAHAETPPFSGPEQRVNAYTSGNQRRPDVAVAPEGDFVVVWTSDGSDGTDTNDYSIQGRRFSPEGVPRGGQFQVNASTPGDQDHPAVDGADDGDFVVVWESRPSLPEVTRIQGQRFASDGSRRGSEIQISQQTSLQEGGPAIAVEADGDFAVTWGAGSAAAEEVLMQRFASDGTRRGSPFRVNQTAANNQRYPAIAAEAGGGFVVAWESRDQDGDFYGIFGRRINASAGFVGPEFPVNSYTTGTQGLARVTTRAGDGFLVTWGSGIVIDDEGTVTGFGQRFGSTGQKRGAEFEVNTTTPAEIGGPDSAFEPDGGFLTTWSSFNPSQVLAQAFDAAGDPTGIEIQINTSYVDAFQPAFVDADAAGGFVVVWGGSDLTPGSGYDVFLRRLGARVHADDFERGDACGWSLVVGSAECS